METREVYLDRIDNLPVHLLEFAQSQYPNISDVKQLTIEQLQHLASLTDVNEFLVETP